MQPTISIDKRFSMDTVEPMPWARGERVLQDAELYWLTTVRKDGRPHTTPLVGLWLDQAFVFTTGPEEQKAVNLHHHPNVTVTTGCNAWQSGLDVVVEGVAERVVLRPDLMQVRTGYIEKYDGAWVWEVGDQGFLREGDDDIVYVFRVVPEKIFGFGKGDEAGQTKWGFS